MAAERQLNLIQSMAIIMFVMLCLYAGAGWLIYDHVKEMNMNTQKNSSSAGTPELSKSGAVNAPDQLQYIITPIDSKCNDCTSVKTVFDNYNHLGKKHFFLNRDHEEARHSLDAVIKQNTYLLKIIANQSSQLAAFREVKLLPAPECSHA